MSTIRIPTETLSIMELQTLVEYIVLFFQTHLLVLIVAATIFIYLLCQKPKVILLLLVVFSLVFGVTYVISQSSLLGETYKKKLIHKSDQAREEVAISNKLDIFQPDVYSQSDLSHFLF